MIKVKLTIDEQIEYMKNQGIKFEKISEEDAKSFLTFNTYFFKLKSFSKNYDKYTAIKKQGQYIGLDFAYLKELSILDVYIRNIILNMTLNIEHNLKVELNRKISNNINENGYTIVADFLSTYPYIQKNLNTKLMHNSPYNNDLINKYNSNFASWNLVELLSFGEFINFYKFYHNRNSSEKDDYIGLLIPVQCIRNAVAHNNCLIHNLSKTIKNEYQKNEDQFNTSKNLNTKVSKINGISPLARKNKLSLPVIHDFAAVLFLFDAVVQSDPTRNKAYKELQLLVNRLYQNFIYFEKNNKITSTFEFIKKLIDHFSFFTYNKVNDQKL